MYRYFRDNLEFLTLGRLSLQQFLRIRHSRGPCVDKASHKSENNSIMHIYEQTTGNIHIEVEPRYVPEHSLPEQDRYVFTYTVKIKNKGSKPVQLISRHWVITDGRGRSEHVKGPGVVGQQPTIKAGETYTYSSFCPLPTPTGNMRGRFFMLDETKSEFEVAIPLFFLRDVTLLH
jgi:ApaG protein